MKGTLAHTRPINYITSELATGSGDIIAAGFTYGCNHTSVE
jgi:hypothetical protein